MRRRRWYGADGQRFVAEEVTEELPVKRLKTGASLCVGSTSLFCSFGEGSASRGPSRMSLACIPVKMLVRQIAGSRARVLLC